MIPMMQALAKKIAAQNDPYGQADQYRAALEKQAYGDSGAAYGQGLDAITRYLAGAGPLADSGAATALKYKLASSVYGKARSQVAGGYADFLRQMLAQKQQYMYQMALARQQKKDSKKGFSIPGAIGGALGFVAGGPGGALAGYGAGSGMGGYSTSDNYANYGYG